MAENITLGTVSTFTNDSSAVATVNNNSVLIQNAFQNVLDRNGTAPNAMNSALDMNNFNIINLPSPASVNSPARLIDVVSNPTISVPAVGTSGSTVPLLNGTNTWTGSQNFSGATVTLPAINTFGTLNITGNTTYSGSVSGTTIVLAGATPPNNTLTLPTSTDTLIGKATTDTLTNKTYDTAGAGNVFKINGNSVTSITGSGNVVFSTSPTLVTPTIGSATATSLLANGSITSSSKTAGVGYSTGAGSTDTQATNKSTTVTSVSNPICGSITMNGALLGAATGVSFTFNNTSIGANDVIIVNIGAGSTGVTGADYNISVSKVSAGSCQISLYNQATGKSDALVLNYAIIKAVTS